MKECRYFYVPDAPSQSELPMEESMHALRVLRLKSGDEMFLMDGKGVFYRAEVTIAATKHCMYEIKEVLPQEKNWEGNIHVAIAPTKDIGRIEWFAEKATEIGVDEYSFLCCQFSERRVVKTPRIEKIVVSAVKQSRKPWMPVINEMTAFEKFVKQPREGGKYICHCYNEIARGDFFESVSRETDNKNITVLVGPEGDFSIDEVRMAMEYGYKPVSLGTSRLRTETAGLYAAMLSHLTRRK